MVSNPEEPIGEAGAEFAGTYVVGNKVGKNIIFVLKRNKVIVSLGVKVAGINFFKLVGQIISACETE